MSDCSTTTSLAESVRIGLSDQHHSLLSDRPKALEPYMSAEEYKALSMDLSSTIGAKLTPQHVQEHVRNKNYLLHWLPNLVALYCGVSFSIWAIVSGALEDDDSENKDQNNGKQQQDSDEVSSLVVLMVVCGILIFAFCLYPPAFERDQAYRDQRTELARHVLRSYTQRYQSRPGQLVFVLQWAMTQRGRYTYFLMETSDGRRQAVEACVQIYIKQRDDDQAMVGNRPKHATVSHVENIPVTGSTTTDANEHYQPMV